MAKLLLLFLQVAKMMTRAQTNISRFVAAMGWPKAVKRVHKSTGREIVWYESGSHHDDLLLQINVLACPSFCVYAMKYNVCSGWHLLPLSIKAESMDKASLIAWAGWEWFQSPTAIRFYMYLHPECANVTSEKLATLREPYIIQHEADNNGRLTFSAIKNPRYSRRAKK
jgi:hypothetical protein